MFQDRDVLLDELVRALTSTEGLQGVAGRIYKRHVAQLKDPEYPCLTLARRGGGETDLFGIVTDFDLFVGAWARESTTAWRLSNAAHRALNRRVVSTSADVWILSKEGDAFDIFDPDGAPTHQVARLYTVRHITAE